MLEVLRQGAPTSGEACIQFEKEFVAYCGTAHARAVSNGTAALFLSLSFLLSFSLPIRYLATMRACVPLCAWPGLSRPGRSVSGSLEHGGDQSLFLVRSFAIGDACSLLSARRVESWSVLNKSMPVVQGRSYLHRPVSQEPFPLGDDFGRKVLQTGRDGDQVLPQSLNDPGSFRRFWLAERFPILLGHDRSLHGFAMYCDPFLQRRAS